MKTATIIRIVVAGIRMPYYLVPFIGWFVSGTVKYLINRIRFGKFAKDKMGNGGFPSTHTTTMVTPTVLIGLNEGFHSAIFGLGVAITYIVILDAMGIRRAIGQHATTLNLITKNSETYRELLNRPQHRESMGHTKIEVMGGIVLGSMLAFVLSFF